MKLLLVRHGYTGKKYVGRYIGSTDLPICSSGHDELEALSQTVNAYDPESYFCSPMRRTKQTMDLIVGSNNQSVEVVDDLREIDFGRWEGLSFAEICRTDQSLVDQWQREACSFCFPDGEDGGLFVKRVQAVADRLKACDHKTVLMVSHGGVIRAMLCYLLGLAPENYLLFDVKPARLAVLDIEQGMGVLAGFNL